MKGEEKIKKEKTTKDWLPFEKILENGIIKNKNNYIKIIKVIPINYDLKSNLEKEAILNAYKLILIFKYLFKVKKKIYQNIFQILIKLYLMKKILKL